MRKCAHAFTAIEALIVVAILMIVSAVLIPKLQRDRDSAHPPRFTQQDVPGIGHLITDTHTGAEYLRVHGGGVVRLEPKPAEVNP